MRVIVGWLLSLPELAVALQVMGLLAWATVVAVLSLTVKAFGMLGILVLLSWRGVTSVLRLTHHDLRASRSSDTFSKFTSYLRY